ncbi:hypothetical protein CRG98_040556 [Punica granatum]|uniref:Bet v I/Major latex protein domain-containing protein n=1 Tax=Punica granatum TaxID=22663 RepID=A0A2I0I4X9_PUNGR|nr:hypothetical protein CRG98_040556 [Punica granatum]
MASREALCGKLQKDIDLKSNGKPTVLKEKVGFNDANMTITIHGIEGDLYNELKVFRLTIKVIPKNNGSVAKLAIEYERLNEDMPIPNNYMDLVVSVVQDTDAHVHRAST